MSAEIRVGLVGASPDRERSWGTRAHIPALRHLPQFELVAVCTSRPETAAETARYFGIQHSFYDPGEMAQHPDVDLVVVSVRTPLHYGIVLAAAAAGKHVYCEWPLGATTAEAREMLAATRQAGVLTMIGMQGGANETLTYVRDLIAEGNIGRVVAVNLRVAQTAFGGRTLERKAFEADVDSGANILSIATGQALAGFSHCVGELREFSAVVSRQYDEAKVYGTGKWLPKTAPDQVLINGTLEGGAVASIHVSGGMTRIPGFRFEINGTEGDLVLVSEGYANLQRAAPTIHRVLSGERALTPLRVPARYAMQPAGLPEGPALAVGHHYVRFLEAWRTGRSPALDFAYAVRWQELLDDVQRASDTGTRVTFPPQANQ